MFGKRYTLFHLLGFRVSLDLSWLILALLVAWSLAEGLFPFYIPGLAAQTYWIMGAAGVVGLLLSIVLHEFSHSLVARRYGLPIGGINLFIFGGVAEMEDEPPSAKSEFLMAGAGPLCSVGLAIVFFGVQSLGVARQWPQPVSGVAFYLAYLNIVLAVFNLLPAFPLDGGRMLRAALWGWRKDIRWATRFASRIGQGFGLALVIVGVFAFLNGYLISGFWWFLIGMFLRYAAEASYRQTLIRETIQGQPVRRFMTELPVTIAPSTTLREFVDDYVYKYHHKMFPIVAGDELKGCLSTAQLSGVPRDEWDRHRVMELSDGCSRDNAVTPDTDAAKALALMTRTGNSRLLVVEGDHLRGILTLKDLAKYLSLRTELEA